MPEHSKRNGGNIVESRPQKANSGSVLESKYFPPVFMTLWSWKAVCYFSNEKNKYIWSSSKKILIGAHDCPCHGIFFLERWSAPLKSPHSLPDGRINLPLKAREDWLISSSHRGPIVTIPTHSVLCVKMFILGTCFFFRWAFIYRWCNFPTANCAPKPRFCLSVDLSSIWVFPALLATHRCSWQLRAERHKIWTVTQQFK